MVIFLGATALGKKMAGPASSGDGEAGPWR